MAVWAAILGAAISIGGRIANAGIRSNAINEARVRSNEKLREGLNMSADNARDLAQDMNYAMSLSGVSSRFGTASMIQERNRIQTQVTLNKKTRDHMDYIGQLRDEQNMTWVNAALGSVGSIFSMMGDIAAGKAANEAAGYESIAPDPNEGLMGVESMTTVPNVSMPQAWISPDDLFTGKMTFDPSEFSRPLEYKTGKTNMFGRAM